MRSVSHPKHRLTHRIREQARSHRGRVQVKKKARHPMGGAPFGEAAEA
jgi:hypothetical protein